ncbi:MAG: ATP-binding protein [Acidimicrobiales bacterium]
MVMFVNRSSELGALDRWWNTRRPRLALLWGRRRVGKTALAQRFAQGKRVVFHTGAGRGQAGELRLLAERVATTAPGGLRDLALRPYSDWDDALDDLASRATEQPLLLVLDEFPELVQSTPGLPGALRAFMDRSVDQTELRILLCGSAVRQMQALQEAREPLYGRFDLLLSLRPFGPHEAALMLPQLSPAERALVYGIAGGMPLYLGWWDQDAAVDENLLRLVCEPSARLLTEGELVLASELAGGDYDRQVLHAIAAGKSQYGEIKDYVRAEPLRTIERLIELQFVERARPVGNSERSRRRAYRIADPFVAFYLGVVTPFRTEIERGLGPSIVAVLRESLDDHMGGVWEEAFRSHLRRMAATGTLDLGAPVVAIGPWWDASGHNEIDALVLTGRSRVPTLAGEAKWARREDGGRLVERLRDKVRSGLRLDPAGLSYAVCAREVLTNVPPGVMAVTASEIFRAGGPPS